MASFVNLIDQRRLIGPGGSTVGGTIAFYYTGTSVLAPVYQDVGMSIPAPNPMPVGAGDIVPLLFLDTDIVYRRIITYADGTYDQQDPLGSLFSEGELGLPVGSVIDFAGPTAPSGFLLCFGQAVSRSAYAELYLAIGTTYGAGNGSTTFNVPDYRGRVAAGKDNMGGASANRLTAPFNGDILGAAGGLEYHVLTEFEMPTHDHGGVTGNNSSNVLAPVSGAVNPLNAAAGAVISSQSHTHTISPDGGGGAHPNVQPTIISNKIIKSESNTFLSLIDLFPGFDDKVNAVAIGIAPTAIDMGSFTGSIIPDNSTAKEALQTLETVLNGVAAPTWDSLIGKPATFPPTGGSGADALATLGGSGGSNLVGFLQSGTGATSRPTQMKLREIVTLEDFGAVGNHNGISGADDNVALTRAIAALPSGGIIKGRNGGRYYFSNPPKIPDNITLVGTFNPHEDTSVIIQPSVASSAIILPAGVTLRTGRGTAITGWLIWRHGMAVPASAATAVTMIAAFAGTAITVDGDDPHIHGNMFLGFEWAVKSNGFSRPEIYNNCGDCTNGIEVSGVYDCGNYGVAFNRFWPYLVSHQTWSDWYLARRSGKAIYVHDTADWLRVQPNFSYGYAVGLHLHNVAGVKAAHSADNIGGHDIPNAAGTKGIYTTGTMNNVLIDQSHVDSCETNYAFEHTGGGLQCGSNTCGSATAYQVFLGPNSSGDLGRMMTRGTTDQVVAVQSGVGLWAGSLFPDVSATSGTAVSIANTADIPKLQITVHLQPSSLLTNGLNYGEPYSVSGSYTPTLTNVANLTALTASPCQFMRVGNCVTVSGKFAVTPTAASTNTVLEMTLPITSDFTAAEDCGGTGAMGTTTGASTVIANGTSNRAQFTWAAPDTINRDMSFMFMYRLK